MPYRLYKILFILTVLAIITGLALFWLAYTEPKNLEVDFLDVGQGDAELIKTPFGQNILVDGSPNSIVLRKLSAELPWWDRTIDLMILTHPHDDHVAGLNDIMSRYEVKKIIMTGVNHTGPAYIKFLENIRNKKIPVTIIDRPQIIELGADCRINILWPEKNLAGQEVENLNNTSIVFKLEHEDTKILFTADIEKEAEAAIMLKPGLLKADVLKVSHHGSEYATSEEFLNLVKPQMAVIEVGANNKFGHPNPRTLKRLERAGAEILRTDKFGTIRLISDGSKIWQMN